MDLATTSSWTFPFANYELDQVVRVDLVAITADGMAAGPGTWRVSLSDTVTTATLGYDSDASGRQTAVVFKTGTQSWSNAAYIFYNLPDVLQSIDAFFQKTLNVEAGVPKADASKAAGMIVEGLTRFTIWKETE